MPGPAALREAALAHIARFATTEAGLSRVLMRRLQRWAQRALSAGADPEEVVAQREQAKAGVAVIVSGMSRIGAVDDAVFAQSRARALARSGRSRRAIGAHLAQHGVGADAAGEAVLALGSELGGAEDAEFAAALMQARRRRIGPYRRDAEPGADEDTAARQQLQAARQRALAALCRAGFAYDVASRALDADLETAEALIARLRSS
nr:RecX family transcriptional regulator [uncultured Lichenicoccus sp.]